MAPAGVVAQGLDWRGEASVALVGSDASKADGELIARYVPELVGTWQIGRSWSVGFDVAADGFASATWRNGARVANDDDVGLYRAWVRIGSPRFEVRAGLQKITFGSGAVFRPLMWFEQVDPRDPLQITEGVPAVLARYYAPGNANVWAWVLRDDDEPAGWSVVESDDRTPEFGGRGQLPLPRGEVGVSYHHRRLDLSRWLAPGFQSAGDTAPEDRVGVDGKWDLGAGL
jgi:hypothetical protein